MGADVVLTSTSLGLVVCAVVIAALLIPVTAGRVQLKVAPVVELVGVYVNGVPVHIAGGAKALLSEATESTNKVESLAIPLATAYILYEPGLIVAGSVK